MIHFNCTCGKTLKVDDELAGHRVKCRHCGKAHEVPEAPEVPESEPETKPTLQALDTSSPRYRAKTRGYLLIALDALRIFVWIGCVVYTATLLNGYSTVLKTAQTAPQQAFFAADACLWLIVGYVIARAIDKGLHLLQTAMGG